MKKLVLIFALGLMSSLIFANHRASRSEFKLRTTDQSSVILFFDGVRYPNSNFHAIRNVRPGNHRVVVKRIYRNAYGNGGRGVVVYDGNIHVQPRTSVKARLGFHNNLSIRTESLYAQNNYGNTCAPPSCGTNAVSNQCANESYNATPNYGYDNYGSHGYSGATCGISVVTSNTCSGGTGNYNRFHQLKMTIQNTSFDNTKLTVAKQGISSGYYNSQQVLELMNLMTFENTKLDLAKFAFNKVQDPQNFYIVNNSFSFSSSVNELAEFTSVY